MQLDSEQTVSGNTGAIHWDNEDDYCGLTVRDLCKTISFRCRFFKSQFNVEDQVNFGEFFAKN